MLRNSVMPRAALPLRGPGKDRKKRHVTTPGRARGVGVAGDDGINPASFGFAPADAESPGDKILEAAMRLFCREGVHATGVDRILIEAGTAKATLYKRFGSKVGLVHEVLRRHGNEWRTWFNAALDARPGGPAERLVAVFDVLQEWFDRDDYFGCAFINAVAEHDKTDEAIRALALDHKRKVLDRVRALAESAGARAPDDLTHQIGILMDGAIIAALVTGSSEPAKTARAAAAALVKSATEPARGTTSGARPRRRPAAAVKRRAAPPGS